MNSTAKELADAVGATGFDRAAEGVLMAKSATAIVEMDSALRMARAVLERTGNLDAPVARLDPRRSTIGEIINQALDAVAEEV